VHPAAAVAGAPSAARAGLPRHWTDPVPRVANLIRARGGILLPSAE
jgi:hypothetical protein